MSIEESNKLIALFMGGRYEYVEEGTECVDFIVKGVLQARVNIKNLKYHSSWDKLMPVVEKISKEPLIGAQTAQDVCYPVTFGMPHTDGTKMFRFAGFALFHRETLIEAAYSAVIDFIQYHNEQSTASQPEGKGKEGV